MNRGESCFSIYQINRLRMNKLENVVFGCFRQQLAVTIKNVHFHSFFMLYSRWLLVNDDNFF